MEWKLANWNGDRAVGFMAGVTMSLCFAGGLVQASPWPFAFGLAILAIAVLLPGIPK